MKQKMWVLVNTEMGKLARDAAGGTGYATRKALKDCFDGWETKRFLADPKYEIRKIEVEV